MIPPLPDLKKILRVTGQHLAIAPMDNRGQRFQLSTIGPGARVVGTAFTKADAEAMAALWRWGAELVEEIERLRMRDAVLRDAPEEPTLAKMEGRGRAKRG